MKLSCRIELPPSPSSRVLQKKTRRTPHYYGNNKNQQIMHMFGKKNISVTTIQLAQSSLSELQFLKKKTMSC